MIGLNNLKPAKGAHHRRKIVGRGAGSGHGGQSTKGMKGQTSRAGVGGMLGFEGGQTPIIRRIPKRGFTNKFRVAYAVLNVGELESLFSDGAEVTVAKLNELGIIKRNLPVKILGSGELKKKLTVKVNAFSASAIEKIKAAGGLAEKTGE